MRDSLRRFLHRTNARPSSQASREFSERATRDDLYHCYRLLLNRPPDAEGWRFYGELVDKGDFSVERLVACFVDSHEYRVRRLEGRRTRTVQLDGFVLHVRTEDKEVGAALAESQTYEPHVTRELKNVLREGAVFVDVGANIGYFTMLAASLVGSGGKVIAFEPNADNCALIRMSLEANSFENVTLHPFAAADVEQEFALEITGSNGALREEPRAGDERVRSVVLDRCLSGEPRIDVMKMDVEGFEGRVLNGANETIARHRPVLFTEFSPADLVRRSRVDPRDYLERIVAFGYELFLLPASGDRATAPQAPAAIIEAHGRSRASHLDLVAYPGLVGR